MEKVAIISGASSGLGRETAAVFLNNGWKVAFLARNREKLESLQKELDPERNTSLVCATDVSNVTQVEDAIRTVLERFGRIDVLINNAGVDFPAKIQELSTAQWDQVIAVNLSGVFYLSKAVFPVMKEQRSGTIINISSVAGKRGWSGATAYCASKFGLTGLSQALHAEGKEFNIRCSTVYPGGMDTSWHAGQNEEFMNPGAVGNFLFQIASQPENIVINEAVITPVIEEGYP